MPKLIAIDSSTATTKVALWQDGELFEYMTAEPRQAAQQLLPLIQHALDAAELKIAQIDAIATATGPGSFTGLRIGIGAAQGLSMANATPLIGISSLALLAHAASKNSDYDSFLVCMPAREHEVYFGAYGRDGPVVTLLENETVIEFNSNTGKQVKLPGKNWFGIGRGWEHRSALESILDIELSECQTDVNTSMENLCQFALEKLKRGECVEAEGLLPNYVKEQLDYRSQSS